jgi:hypothetical protein
MPWPPDQARAIAASYSKRGKPIPGHVKDELRSSLTGKRRKKKRSSARDTLAGRMTKRRRHRRHK